MEDVIVYELDSLGFGPFFERQLQPWDGRGGIPARIAAEHRGAYEVWSQAGAGPAQLAGRFRLEPEEAGLPGVGDWVVLKDAPGPDRTAIIERVLARRTVFTRGAAGRQVRAQVVAANIDDTEPGCAVKRAVESGSLAAERLDHYRKLEREAQAYALRHDERLRRQSERVWGQLSDEVARLRRWKMGE